MTSVKLPRADGDLESYTLRNAPLAVRANGAPPRLNRIAYAAAHVVANPLADNEPWLDTAVDWERTIAFRHYLWDLGLGVAEAMDTAQRGMGLDWNGARELIRRSLEAAKSRPGALIASGAGTEQLERVGERDDRRCDPRLRDADRGDRGDGRTHRLDGEPGAGQSGESSGRLRQGLCAHPRPGEGAGDHSLAGRDVRSCARRLLGQQRSRRCDGNSSRCHSRQRDQGGWHQDLASVEGQGDRDAPRPCARRAHVHRRRLQLSGADRG